MTIPDEALRAADNAIADAVGHTSSISTVMLASAALTAALPFLTGVKVKALEWKEESGLSAFGSSFKAAAGTIGYRIFQQSPKHKSRFIVTTLGVTSHPDNIVSEVNTLDAAKAAAQADYDARIRSAIDIGNPITAPSPRAQALEEEEFAIDKLRFRAFHTNSDADRQAYFDAVSKWFQDRHYRRMDADRTLSSKPVADGWLPIETAPEGIAVETKIDDERGERNIQALVKRTRVPGETRPMFWLTDGSMYVYYEPTHWRPLPSAPGASE